MLKNTVHDSMAFHSTKIVQPLLGFHKLKIVNFACFSKIVNTYEEIYPKLNLRKLQFADRALKYQYILTHIVNKATKPFCYHAKRDWKSML